MSKYNIDDIVRRTPLIGPHTKSELTSPNAIRTLINKITNTKKIVDEINSICKITFLAEEDVIVFKPRFLKGQCHANTIYGRDYVKKLLYDLGFDTYVFHDIRYCSTVSLSLRELKNKQRLQQLGNVFEFEYETPVLTQSILDSIKQNKR